MKKISRIIAIAVLALSLGSGVASAATGTIGTTGPDSNNEITVNNHEKREVRNHNSVRVDNDSKQYAHTGEAEVGHNTTGGDATTGDTANDNMTRANVSVSNVSASHAVLSSGGSGSDSGSINNTGPDSNNVIKFDNNNSVEVDNHNYVNVDNWSYQTATSGDAKVYGNTTGGDATSGDATNVNTSEFTIRIEN